MVVNRTSKLWLAIAVAIFVAIAVIANLPEANSWFGGDGSAPESSGAASDTGAAEQRQDPLTLARPAGATLSHIAYVYDGDTLYLRPEGAISRADEIKVRLIGVDSPELRPTVECFGVEARDHLRALLPEGTPVWVEADREPLDQYGRSLLYLWTTDGRSVNLDLVKDGFATALRIAPNDTHWDVFDAAEAEARNSAAGLWGAC